MKILGRRIWYDMQIGVYGSLIGFLLRLVSRVPASQAFSQFWHSLMWLVPSCIVGTEIARGVHWLIHRNGRLRPGTKPSQPAA